MKKHPAIYIILVIIGCISVFMALNLVIAVLFRYIGMETEKHTDSFIDSNRGSLESIEEGYIRRLYDYADQCKAPVERLTLEQRVLETGELELTIERRYYKAPNDPVVTKREIIADEIGPIEEDDLFMQLCELMKNGYDTEREDVSVHLYIADYGTIAADFYSRQGQEDCRTITFGIDKQAYENGDLSSGEFYYYDKDHRIYWSK